MKWQNTLQKHVNPLSANLTKWLNTFKQFVGFYRRVVWVCLTILWGWCVKALENINPNLKHMSLFEYVTRFNPLLSTTLDILFESKFCACALKKMQIFFKKKKYLKDLKCRQLHAEPSLCHLIFYKNLIQ